MPTTLRDKWWYSGLDSKGKFIVRDPSTFKSSVWSELYPPDTISPEGFEDIEEPAKAKVSAVPAPPPPSDNPLLSPDYLSGDLATDRASGGGRRAPVDIAEDFQKRYPLPHEQDPEEGSVGGGLTIIPQLFGDVLKMAPKGVVELARTAAGPFSRFMGNAASSPVSPLGLFGRGLTAATSVALTGAVGKEQQTEELKRAEIMAGESSEPIKDSSSFISPQSQEDQQVETLLDLFEVPISELSPAQRAKRSAALADPKYGNEEQLRIEALNWIDDTDLSEEEKEKFRSYIEEEDTARTKFYRTIKQSFATEETKDRIIAALGKPPALSDIHKRLSLYRPEHDPSGGVLAKILDRVDRMFDESLTHMMYVLSDVQEQQISVDPLTGEFIYGLEDLVDRSPEHDDEFWAYHYLKKYLPEEELTAHDSQFMGPTRTPRNLDPYYSESMDRATRNWRERGYTSPGLATTLTPSYGPIDWEIDGILGAATAGYIGLNKLNPGSVAAAFTFSAGKKAVIPFFKDSASRLLRNYVGDKYITLIRSQLRLGTATVLARKARTKVANELDTLERLEKLAPTEEVLFQISKAKRRLASASRLVSRADTTASAASKSHLLVTKEYRRAGIYDRGARSAEIFARNIGYSLLYNSQGNRYMVDTPPEDQKFWKGMLFGVAGAGAAIRTTNIFKGASRAIENKSWIFKKGASDTEGAVDPMVDYLQGKKPPMLSRLFGGTLARYGKEVPPPRSYDILVKLGLIPEGGPKLTATEAQQIALLAKIKEYDFNIRSSDYEVVSDGAKVEAATDVGGALLHSDVADILQLLPLPASSKFNVDDYVAMYRDLLQYEDDTFYNTMRTTISDSLEGASDSAKETGQIILGNIEVLRNRLARVRSAERELGVKLLPDEPDAQMQQFLRDQHNYYHQNSDVMPLRAGEDPVLSSEGTALGPNPRSDVEPAATRGGEVGDGAQLAKGRKDSPIWTDGGLDKVGDEMFVYQGTHRLRLLRTESGVESTLEVAFPVKPSELYNKAALELDQPFSLFPDDVKDVLKNIFDPVTLKKSLAASNSSKDIADFLDSTAVQLGIRTGREVSPAVRKAVKDLITSKGANRLKWVGIQPKSLPKSVLEALRLSDPAVALSTVDEAFIKHALYIATRKGLQSRNKAFYQLVGSFQDMPENVYRPVQNTEVLIPKRVQAGVPAEANSEFINGVLQRQLDRLRNSHRRTSKEAPKLRALPSTRKNPPLQVSASPVVVGRGVTVPRGSRSAVSNVENLGGSEIPHERLPAVLYGVSLNGHPKKLQATRRRVGKTDPNISLFTSEGSATSVVLAFTNAVSLARAELAAKGKIIGPHAERLPAALAKENPFELLISGGPMSDSAYKTLKGVLEDLHNNILFDRKIGLIPDDLYYKNLSKWVDVTSAEGKAFWEMHDYSPTEVYKAYLSERSAALGIPDSPITLSVKQLSSRRVSDIAVSRVSRGDIPKQALVVGDIPGAGNNVRVFADGIVPVPYTYADDLPFEMTVANAPVNRLGLRIVPKEIDLELWRPLTEVEAQGRSKGAGLTPRQRREDSLPISVEGRVLKPNALDGARTLGDIPTKWHSKYLQGSTIDKEGTPTLITELRDMLTHKLLVDKEWSSETAAFVEDVIRQQNPFFEVSAGWKGYGEILRGETPARTKVGITQIIETTDEFTGETVARKHPVTEEVVVNPRDIDPDTGQPRKHRVVVRPKKGDPRGGDTVANVSVRLRSGNMVFAGRKELNEWLDTLDINPARKKIIEKSILMKNLMDHLTRREGGGWYGQSAGRLVDTFRKTFSLPDASPQTRASAYIIQAEQGVHRAYMNMLYRDKFSADTFANMAGKDSVEEIFKSIETITELNPKSAYDVTTLDKSSKGNALHWKPLNAYWHGTPENGFKDGVWAILERGEVPPNPPSTQVKLDAGIALDPRDLTGTEIRLIQDILDDIYMGNALTDIAKTLEHSPTGTKEMQEVFDNYFPRSYDMAASRRVFAARTRSQDFSFGSSIREDPVLADLAPELVGVSLHRDPFRPSSPNEQDAANAFKDARMIYGQKTPWEKIVGPRRNTYEKLLSLGYDPKHFGFLRTGFDDVSHMIQQGFIPSTTNMVELYQFKKYEIDRYVLRKRTLQHLADSGVFQKTTTKDWQSLQADLGTHGVSLTDHWTIVGAGEKALESVKSNNSEAARMAGYLDSEFVSNLAPNEILIAPNSVYALVDRWVRPRSIFAYTEGKEGATLGHSALQAWRETNNTLQNFQLGFGFFHLGTMFSESMGSSLESFLTQQAVSAARGYSDDVGFPKVPGKGAKGGADIDWETPIELPAQVMRYWALGRLGKFLVPGSGVVRDAAHMEGLLREGDFYLPKGAKIKFGGKEYPGKRNYPWLQSLPLQLVASLLSPIKRGGRLEGWLQAKAQKRLEKILTGKPRKDGWVIDSEALISTPVLRHKGQKLNITDKSLGSMLDRLQIGAIPSKDIDLTTKSVIQQMVLGNMRFPSQKYGRAYQRKVVREGRRQISELASIWERGEEALGVRVSDKKVIQQFKNTADMFIHWSAWMFDEMIPQAKGAAFMERFRVELQKMGPDATPGRVRRRAQHVQDSIENRFGMVQYDNFFWNNKVREMLHMVIRSVGWNMGTLKEVLWGGPADLVKYGALKSTRKAQALMGMPEQARAQSFGRVSEWSTRSGYALAMVPWKIFQGTLLELAFTSAMSVARHGDFRESSTPWTDLTWEEDKSTFYNFAQSFAKFVAPYDGQVDSFGRPTRFVAPDYSKDVAVIWMALAEGGLPGFTKAGATMAGHKFSPVLHFVKEATNALIGSNENFWGVQRIGNESALADWVGFVAEQFVPFSVTSFWYQFNTLEKPLLFSAASLGLGLVPANRWFVNTPGQKAMMQSYEDRPARSQEKAYVSQAERDIEKKIAKHYNSRDPKKIAEALELLQYRAKELNDIHGDTTLYELFEELGALENGELSLKQAVAYRLYRNSSPVISWLGYNRFIKTRGLKGNLGLGPQETELVIEKLLNKVLDNPLLDGHGYILKSIDQYMDREKSAESFMQVLTRFSPEERALAWLHSNTITPNVHLEQRDVDAFGFHKLAALMVPEYGKQPDLTLTPDRKRMLEHKWYQWWWPRAEETKELALLFNRIYSPEESQWSSVTEDDIEAANFSKHWYTLVMGELDRKRIMKEHRASGND